MYAPKRTRWDYKKFIVSSDDEGTHALITPPSDCTGSVEVWEESDEFGSRLIVGIFHHGPTCPIHEGSEEDDNSEDNA